MTDDGPPPPNGWAIASVLCGVVGCLGFTPFVADSGIGAADRECG